MYLRLGDFLVTRVAQLAAGKAATCSFVFPSDQVLCSRIVRFVGHDGILPVEGDLPAPIVPHNSEMQQPTRPALRNGGTVILSKDRDPRLITIRRGGTLTDSDHRLLALWAAACAEHVLHLFESVQPSDARPRQAVEQIRAWARCEIRMSESRAAGDHAMAAARELSGAARHAASAAGQAAVVAHVAAHELGAAAYAIKAARAAATGCEADSAGRIECRWQREQLPHAIRALVLDDQRVRNEICWSVFDC